MDPLIKNPGDTGQSRVTNANSLAMVEDVLRAHPGVREAAVIQDSSNRVVAFVVPDNQFVDNELGRAATGSMVVDRWRKIFNLSQLSKHAGATAVGFNTMGWDSSYTRRPIPEQEMLEWVENTVGDILRLRPKVLCEIGCGTGMMVMRVAPHCDRYVAIDQSPAVLERLQQQLQTLPEVANRVEVVECQAAKLDHFSENTFDTVVLSSVVQFFPNIGYLTGVLENAIAMVRPGGHVYVGDVRSLPLLNAFASSVELFQATDELGAHELRERIRRHVEKEPEMAISPAFFLNLSRTNQKISRVDIRPLRGHSDNEMTRFRYEAILHVGNDNEAVFDGEFLDWTEHRWGLDEIRSILRQHAGQPIGVGNIVNARLEKDLAAMAILDVADAAVTAGEIRKRATQNLYHGLHPQALFDLGKEDLGYAVFLSWTACRHDGGYDAFFIPQKMLHRTTLPAIIWPKPDASVFTHLASTPGQSKIRNEFVARLASHCRENLPTSFASPEILLVDTLPKASDSDGAAPDLLKTKSSKD